MRRSDSVDSMRESIVEKPKGKVKEIVRKCPVLVDVVFVCLQLGLALTLGFFSYFYPVLDNRQCAAVANSDLPITIE